MEEKLFNSRVSAEIEPAKLRGIYLQLEDEATPHAVRVSNRAPGIKHVTIYCDNKDVAYFTKFLSNEN